MDDLRSFESIVDRFEAMSQNGANNNPPASAAPTTEPVTATPNPLSNNESLPVKLQSIEDFDAEQDALDLQRQLTGEAVPGQRKESPSEPPRRIPKPLIEPNRKKAKKETDPEELDAEERAVKEMGNANWVGRLQIYRDTHPVPGAGTGLDWTESVEVNPLPRFSCVLVIHETLNRFGYETIGSTPKLVSFGNKKTAKQYAAKKAVDWLTTNEYIPKDGAARHKSVPVPLPKKVKIPPPKPKVKAQQTPAAAITNCPGSPSSPLPNTPPGQTTFAGRIPELCHKLGINIPTYKFHQATPGSPLCDAYADFGDDPSIEGKVGQVMNIFGKKNAKEAVAKIAYAFLKDIERQRLKQFEEQQANEPDFISFSDNDEEDVRKRKRATESGSPLVESKAIKVEA